MKIKRFYANTMRAALQQVREEQGPDAVILSNRPVVGGIEVIAAVDYDESLFHQGFGRPAAQTRSPEPSFVDQASPAADEESVQISARARSAAQEEPYTDKVAELPSSATVADTTPAALYSEAAAEFELDAPIAIVKEPVAGHVDSVDGAGLSALNEELKSLRTMMQEEFSAISFNDLQRKRPALAPVIRRLNQLGLEHALIESLVNIIPAKADEKYAWRTVLALLSKRLPMAPDDLLETGGTFAFVGPTGVGKTTTLAKVAAKYRLRHGADSVALISTDKTSIGAQQQLFRIGKILGVTVRFVTDANTLDRTLERLGNKSLVLIDTPGYGHRDGRLLEALAMLTSTAVPIQPLLTLAANSQTESIKEAIQAFGCIELAGTVITKIDEASSLGGTLSAVLEATLPVYFVSDGQQIPADLHVGAKFRAELVSRAVQLIKQPIPEQTQRNTADTDFTEEEPRLSNQLRQAVSNG